MKFVSFTHAGTTREAVIDVTGKTAGVLVRLSKD